MSLQPSIRMSTVTLASFRTETSESERFSSLNNSSNLYHLKNSQVPDGPVMFRISLLLTNDPPANMEDILKQRKEACEILHKTIKNLTEKLHKDYHEKKRQSLSQSQSLDDDPASQPLDTRTPSRRRQGLRLRHLEMPHVSVTDIEPIEPPPSTQELLERVTDQLRTDLELVD